MDDPHLATLEKLTREALGWRLRAELLGLSQMPTTPAAYIARVVEHACNLLGASQVVFWAHEPGNEVLEARHAASFEPVASVPRGVFQEAIAWRGPTTAAFPDIHGNLRAVALGPVYLDDGLYGVFQVVPGTPTMDPGLEVAVGILAETVSAGLRTVMAFERLSFEASHDPLTGLANRRTFNAFLERELKLAERHKAPLSLLVVDADHFKRYNDTYGHPAGDALLKALAGRLLDVVRTTDFVARYGGEEFVVVLPHTDREGALAVAHKMLRGMRTLHSDVTDLPGDHVTVSIGLATFTADATDAQALFQVADQALYRAKHGGRDRVECA